MFITSAFDSGNISVIEATNPNNIRLKINNDHQSDFLQWFHFRVSNVEDQELVCHIENAGGAAYVDGWPGYQALATYDREDWFRVETNYDSEKGVLTFKLDAEESDVWFAYFVPYSEERHHDLISDVAASPLARLEVLGHTLDGRAMDMITIGDYTEGKKRYWMIARQHPGETMAEWWMEGALEKLIDPDDPTARRLLQKAVFHIVPNMNPDGSFRGHLRTNAAGVNLNRVWHDPKMETEPEVALVRGKMLELGCDFHLDVHGDEALPYNFLAGFEGIPNPREGQIASFERYRQILDELSPDFQQQYGYDIDAPGEANMTVCTNYMAQQFGCVSATLEMPFKDNDNLPDVVTGWSPARAAKLAHSCLDALLLWTNEQTD